MADDKKNAELLTELRLPLANPIELAYFAKQHGITQAQARALIKKHGNMRKTLDAAAKRLSGK